MKAVLICPGERPGVSHLGDPMPLAAVPIMGQSLIEYWVTHLACTGHREILVLANDRAQMISDIVGDGSRWGLGITVHDEARELTPTQAALKYRGEIGDSAPGNGIVAIDHLPGGNVQLFSDYASWLNGIMAWMPHARTPDRVGIREVRPGIYAGLHAVIHPQAKLSSPCWIGKHAYIGDGAIIGPNSIIEDGCFVEPAAEITNSFVGIDTFVGRFNSIQGSIAWGSVLINGTTGSAIKVPDPFLMCALRPARKARRESFFARMSDFYNRNKVDAHLLWKHLLMNKQG